MMPDVGLIVAVAVWSALIAGQQPATVEQRAEAVRGTAELAILASRRVADVTYGALSVDPRTDELLLSDLRIGTGGPLGEIVIGTVSVTGLNIAGTGDPVGDGVRMAVSDLVIDLTGTGLPEEVREAVEVTGYDTLRFDASLVFGYDMAQSTLTTEILAEAHGAGALEIAFRLENLHMMTDVLEAFDDYGYDYGYDPYGVSPGMTSDMPFGGNLGYATVRYTDHGLVPQLIALFATMEGLPPQQALETMQQQLDGMAQNAMDPVEHDLFRALQTFLETPSGLSITLDPATPMPFSLIAEALDLEAFDLLNPVVAAYADAPPKRGSAALIQIAALRAGMTDAAEPGADIEARAALGRAFQEGRGAPQNYAAAVSWLEPAVEAGNPEAQYLLSRALADGLGIAADPEEAYTLALLAAAAAQPAAGELADRLERDLAMAVVGRAQDAALSRWRGGTARGAQVALILDAAASGTPDAMRRAALAHYRGDGIPRHYVRAHAWANLAAAAGDVEAARLRDRIAGHGTAGGGIAGVGLLDAALLAAAQDYAQSLWDGGIGNALVAATPAR